MTCVDISVIIPFHNREQYFEECLDSVLRQTFPPHEIIVVDDGSHQHAHEFLERFVKHIQIIRHPSSQGCCAARNTGITAAQGNLIAFLDDDDLWEPSKLETQMAYLRDHQECDAVHTGLTVFYANGTERVFDQKPAIMRIEDALTYPSHVILSSFLIRTEIIRRVGGFDSGLTACEDRELSIRLVEAGCQIHFIPKPLIRFRRTGQTSLSARHFHHTIQQIKLLRKHRKIYDRVRGPGAARRELAASIRRYWAGTFLGRGTSLLGRLLVRSR